MTRTTRGNRYEISIILQVLAESTLTAEDKREFSQQLNHIAWSPMSESTKLRKALGLVENLLYRLEEAQSAAKR